MTDRIDLEPGDEVRVLIDNYRSDDLHAGEVYRVLNPELDSDGDFTIENDEDWWYLDAKSEGTAWERVNAPTVRKTTRKAVTTEPVYTFTLNEEDARRLHNVLGHAPVGTLFALFQDLRKALGDDPSA